YEVHIVAIADVLPDFHFTTRRQTRLVGQKLIDRPDLRAFVACACHVSSPVSICGSRSFPCRRCSWSLPGEPCTWQRLPSSVPQDLRAPANGCSSCRTREPAAALPL